MLPDGGLTPAAKWPGVHGGTGRGSLAPGVFQHPEGKADKDEWLGDLYALDVYIVKELTRAIPMTDPK